jgi:hypothetical protein
VKLGGRLRRSKLAMMNAATEALLVALLIPVPLLATGCFGGSITPATTTLRIAFGPDDGNPGLIVCHPSCNPARGSVPNPSTACAALAHDPTLT